MGISKFNAGDNPVMDYDPIQERVETLLVASGYRNWDKPQPDGPLCLYTCMHSFTMCSLHSLVVFKFNNVLRKRGSSDYKHQGP